MASVLCAVKSHPDPAAVARVLQAMVGGPLNLELAGPRWQCLGLLLQPTTPGTRPVVHQLVRGLHTWVGSATLAERVLLLQTNRWLLALLDHAGSQDAACHVHLAASVVALFANVGPRMGDLPVWWWVDIATRLSRCVTASGSSPRGVGQQWQAALVGVLTATRTAGVAVTELGEVPGLSTALLEAGFSIQQLLAARWTGHALVAGGVTALAFSCAGFKVGELTNRGWFTTEELEAAGLSLAPALPVFQTKPARSRSTAVTSLVRFFFFDVANAAGMD